MKISLLLLPIISAFIGWFTNWIAIKMLFHPREPKKFFFITFQGIFPKRQQQFAEKLGQLVSKELISFEDIKSKLNNPAMIDKAMPHINQRLDEFLKTKLSEHIPLISMFIGNDKIEKIKGSISDELRASLPIMIENVSIEMQKELDIEKIVTDKVSAFSSDKLEEILNAIMKKEFVFVEIIGGVLGFLIGILQIVMTLWF
jgi:uncharacterized membrane protein YheB (UPF0754 family)